MSHHTLTLQTIVRCNKANAQGEIPIYLKIIVGSKPVEIATKQYVTPIVWSSEKNRVKGNTEAARTVNAYLDNLKTRLQKIFNTLQEKGETITAEKIKNLYLGKTVRQKTLVEVFQYHNEKMRVQVGTGFATTTYKKYITTLHHIEAFMKYQYKVSDMVLSELNHEFITQFEFWCKTVQGCNHNSTMKYIISLRKIIRLAIDNDWLTKNPFTRFKVTHKESKREALTGEEMQRMITKEFSISRLEQIRDVFIFCCYTGLAYADVEKLTPQQISRGIDGKYWIFTDRTKTGTASNIPLLSPALALIEKYKNHPQAISKGRIFPVLTNQKMNAYLKEIADLCSITKNLTTHLARHTFATTITLTNGVPIETVSSMLGHKNMKTTQIYAKVVQTKVSNDMDNLENKMAKKQALNSDETSKTG
ncbi:MAG: site-specific integrase [Verrucomicrobia bacterium]|nr:site-specific integrase [Cytophagales bacterium]